MILALLACIDPDSQPSGSTASCTGIRDVTAEVTDMPTVVRVRWTTAESVESWVSFDTADGVAETPRTAGTTHEALLLGLRARTDVAYRVLTDTDCAAAGTVTTGALPAGLPEITLTAGSAEGGPPFVLLPVFTENDVFLAILDAAGEYVWAWHEGTGDKPSSWFGAELSRDGTVLANAQAPSTEEPGRFIRLGLDGTVGEPLQIAGAHTDFAQLPDGTIAALGWEIRNFEGRNLLGDTILEVSPEGETTEVWSVFDDYTPDLSRTYTTGWYPGDPSVEDWSHINGISYDAADDTFLVTTSFRESVLDVRRDGMLAWELRNEDGDWANADDADLVRYPHSVQAVDGGVLVFNRGDIHDTEACSEATEVALDPAEGTARRVWAWDSGACLLVPFLGSATRREDGSTVVDWTSAGQLDAVSPEGELTWRLQAPLGAAFGFADVRESLYGE